MARIPDKKTLANQVQIFKERIEAQTGINHWSEDSAIKSLVDTLSSSIVDDRRQTRSSIESIQVSSAKGMHLDAIGQSYGVSRNASNFASSYTSERNFIFYTEGGATFGELSGGPGIEIPKGTTINMGVENSRQVTYKTKKTIILDPSKTYQYCEIEAISKGAYMNCAPHALNSHTFKGVDGLKCMNKYAILNGRDTESDEDYRYRITSNFASLSQSNLEKIKLTALNVPGVLNIEAIPGYFGIGTCAVFIFGASGYSNGQLVTRVQSVINSYKVPGLSAIATAGIEVKFHFDMVIKVKDDMTSMASSKMISSITSAIRRYLAENNVRKSVSIIGLHEYIISQNPQLIGITRKQDRANEFFEGVFIERSYATSQRLSVREELIGKTYSLDVGEFAGFGSCNIIVETI